MKKIAIFFNNNWEQKTADSETWVLWQPFSHWLWPRWSTWLCFHIAHAPKRQNIWFSSLVALQVVKMITSNAAGDNIFVLVHSNGAVVACIPRDILIFSLFMYNLLNVPSSVVMINDLSFNECIDYICEKNKRNHSITETLRWSWWPLCGCWLQLWLSLLKLDVQLVAGDDRGDCVFHSWNSDSTSGNLWHCFLPRPFFL